MNKSANEKEIYVLGSNASGIENLPSQERNLILSTKNIAIPKRLISKTEKWFSKNSLKKKFPRIFPTDKPRELINWIKECDENIVVIASGDPLWYGIGKTLLEAFPKEQIHFFPRLSSLQIIFARLKHPWQEVSWISVHGRDPEILIEELQKKPKSLAILPDPNRGGAEEIRKVLKGIGIQERYEFWIGERLGDKKERVFQVNPLKPIEKIDPLHLVVLLPKKYSPHKPESLPIIGIPDGIFLHQEDQPGLITKHEIRVQLLASLELPKEGILWDLGAGVGSIGLEAIRLRPNLKLLAIEKRYRSFDLINKNATLLGVKPTLILEEDIIDVLKKDIIPSELSQPDRIIIGGGGSYRIPILREVLKRIKPNGIIVIPLATIEAIGDINSYLKSKNISSKISQHQNWRGVPLAEGTRLSPQNPVFIIKIINTQMDPDF